MRYVILLLLFSGIITVAQAQETYWKRYKFGGGHCCNNQHKIISTSDSGMVVAGHYDHLYGVLFKVDSLGDPEWFNITKSTVGETNLIDAIELNSGDFIGCGNTEVSFGNNDLYLIKTDALGNTLWAKTYGGTGSYNGNKIVHLPDDNFLIVGPGQSNTMVTKFNSSGAILWNKSYVNTSNGTDLKLTNDGGFIVTGSTIDIGAGSSDIVVIKCDSSGNVQWSNTYGWSTSEQGLSILEVGNNFMLIATTTLFDTSGDLLSVLIDETGNILWSKIYPSNGSVYPNESILASDSSVVIANANNEAGSFSAGVIKIQNDGTLSWAYSFTNPHHEYATGILIEDNNQIILTGEDANVSTTNDNIFIMKLTPEGILGCSSYSPVILPHVDSLILKGPAALTINNPLSPAGILYTSMVLPVVIDTLCHCENFFDPEIEISGCYNEPALFNYPADTNNELDYFWDFGDGNTSTDPDPLHLYSSTGVYQVTLLITNANGCDASKTVSFDFQNSAADFNYTTDSLVAEFNDPNPYAIAWLWDFGDGNTDTVSNPTHTYLTDGQYNVCLTTITLCDSTELCDSITVCAPMAAGFYFTDTLLTVNFTDTSSGNVTNWNWDFGDGNTDTVSNPTHTYLTDGQYNVCLTTITLCDSIELCDSITVCAPMAAGFYFTDTLLTVNFTDTSSGNVTNWNWDFGDGISSNMQSPVHTYSGPGTYFVCMVITNLCGTDTLCESLSFDISGIMPMDEMKYARVYPNPFYQSTNIYFNNPNAFSYDLIIFNSQGVQLRTITGITGESVLIERQGLANGVYFYQIKKDQSIMHEGKLILN